MKPAISLFLVLIFFTFDQSYSQVSINKDGAAPHTSAALDIKSTNQGVLLPRLTLDQMRSIESPANGLLVFNTDDSKLYIYLASGNVWKEVDLGTGTYLPPPEIGHYRDGGIVFYLNGMGGGMVCPASDQGSGAIWSTGGSTGATATSMNNGWANTENIVAYHGSGSYAAKICDDLLHNSYDDWFLPCKDELHQMFTRKDIIDSVAALNSGSNFSASYYWSSSEATSSQAWNHDFSVNGQYWQNKGISQQVRCVRYFGITYLIGTGNSCNNTVVNGNYFRQWQLNGSHTVDIDVKIFETGDWCISTDTVNGYYFSGSGSFSTTGYQTITLNGSGTPQIVQTDTFTATADTAGDLSQCSFTVDVLPVIGDYYGGGVVFYMTGGTGLICAVSDQSSGIQWGGQGTATGATSTAIGTGQSNTAAIVATLGAGTYAAKICDDLVMNEYDDWYLPSKDELNEIYLQMSIINPVAIAHGGSSLGLVHYWSSSEIDNISAWSHSFSTGGQYYTNKNVDTYNVRAIRVFGY